MLSCTCPILRLLVATFILKLTRIHGTCALEVPIPVVRALLNPPEDIQVQWAPDTEEEVAGETLRRIARAAEENQDQYPKGSDTHEGGGGGDTKPGELYLPDGYNKLAIPMLAHHGQQIKMAVPVFMELKVRSITEINEADDELVFEMECTLQWVDFDLLFTSLKRRKLDSYVPDTPRILDPSFLNMIWKPDIFIEKMVSITQPDFMGKPASLEFSSTGLITYRTRVTVKIKCDFDFGFYPADTQKCDVTFRSYSHDSQELQFQWLGPVGVYLLYPEDDNFDIAVDSVRRFQLITFHGKINNKTFDCLRFTILARRRLSYHLIQTYVPSMLYIAITWLCFMVPKRMIEARMAIVMTTLLTLTAMFASVRESTPVVSYTKAIDIWMLSCITFVFMVLMEFSVLLWTESAKGDNEDVDDSTENEGKVTADGKYRGGGDATDDEHEMTALSSSDHPPPPSDLSIIIKRRAVKVRGRATTRKLIGQRSESKVMQISITAITFIEHNSFVLILCIFMLFNMLYWSWLLVSSEYGQWSVNSTFNAGANNDREEGGTGRVLERELDPY